MAALSTPDRPTTIFHHEPVRWQAARAVGDAIDDMRAPGTFAAWQTRAIKYLTKDTVFDIQNQFVPGPESGVVVDGVGAIRFPLDEEQAQAIIDKARLSAHGQAEQMNVDSPANKIWELSADQFSLLDDDTNQTISWSHLQRYAKGVVAGTLGITLGASSVRVEPYKMLLYEKGAFINQQTK